MNQESIKRQGTKYQIMSSTNIIDRDTSLVELMTFLNPVYKLRSADLIMDFFLLWIMDLSNQLLPLDQ